MPTAPTIECTWMLGCHNPAEGAVEHPVLGWVLTCPRCADRFEQVLEPAQIMDGKHLWQFQPGAAPHLVPNTTIITIPKENPNA